MTIDNVKDVLLDLDENGEPCIDFLEDSYRLFNKERRALLTRNIMDMLFNYLGELTEKQDKILNQYNKV